MTEQAGNYRAFQIHRDGRAGRDGRGGNDKPRPFSTGVASLSHAPLARGEVLIRVLWSGVNYKDALAGTGRAPILRVDELNGGIDLAGVVEDSAADGVNIGDEVLANGCGLSESLDGGFAEYVRLSADLVIPVPGGLDARSAMLVGTAGFTAALSLHAMQQNGQTPEHGPVAVTGASGGVGSFAVHLLSRLGYECTAITRSPDAHDYLTRLGASEVISAPAAVDEALGRMHWGGAIDNLGGPTLATLLKTTREWGNVVSVGLAQSASLQVSVMPFIIRGVSLLGVTSTNCPMDLRRELWRRLGDEWLPDCLDAVHADTVTLDDLPAAFDRVLAGEVRGRILVEPGASA